MAPHLRRIARAPYSNTEEQPNLLWACHAPMLEWLTRIADPALELTTDEEIALYTAVRSRDVPDYIIEAYKSSLPADVAALPANQIGYSETDILLWALHVPDKPILQLVGGRGAGKSTTLRYLFSHLPQRIAGLARICAAFIDLRYPTPPFAAPDSPTNFEIATALVNQLHEVAARSARGSLRPLVDPARMFLASNSPDRSFQSIDNFVLGADNASMTFAIELVGTIAHQLHTEGNSLLLIFDNLDQLRPIAAARVFQLATSLAKVPHIRIVLPLRPWNLNISAVQVAKHAGLLTWKIDLAPPSMRSLIQRRLSWIDQSKIQGGQPHVPMPGGIAVEFKTLNSILDQLLQFLDHSGAMTTYLEGIGDTDTRRKLSAVRAALRWTDLPLADFLKAQTLGRAREYDAVRSLQQSLRPHHLLSAMLCGPRRHFMQMESFHSTPILNLFDTPGTTDPSRCTVAYRLLSIASVQAQPVSFSSYVELASGFGYDRELIRASLSRLLQWGLLYSAEHDWDIDAVAFLRLSPIGSFYLGTIIQDPDYLFHVVFDTLLPHAGWRPDGADDFKSVRYESCRELLSEVMLAEQREMECMAGQHARTGTMIAVMTGMPTASRIVRDSLLSKLNDGLGGPAKVFAQESHRLFREHDEARVDEHLDRITRLRSDGDGVVFPRRRLGEYRLSDGLALEVAGPAGAMAPYDQLEFRFVAKGTRAQGGRHYVNAVVDIEAPQCLAGTRCVPIMLPQTQEACGRVNVVVPLHNETQIAEPMRARLWVVQGDRVIVEGRLPA